jgi:hypothetical protein
MIQMLSVILSPPIRGQFPLQALQTLLPHGPSEQLGSLEEVQLGIDGQGQGQISLTFNPLFRMMPTYLYSDSSQSYDPSRRVRSREGPSPSSQSRRGADHGPFS